MDCTANTVLQLVEEFWHRILGNGTVFLDVSQRRSVYHVANGEAFNGLVFGNAFPAVCTP